MRCTPDERDSRYEPRINTFPAAVKVMLARPQASTISLAADSAMVLTIYSNFDR